MEIIQFEPEHKALRDQFINFPFSLYQNDPNWVPPLRMDIRNIFNRKKHGFFNHGEAQFLLAIENGKTVGRMVTLANINPQNGKYNSTGNFYFFEAVNDFNVAQKMLNRSVAWAKDRKLGKLFGPKGMTPLDGLGILVNGFEYRPAFGIPYNPSYYPDFLIKFGFKKLLENESGLIINDRFSLPEKVFRASEIVRKKKGLSILSMHSRRDLREAASMLGNLYNQVLNNSENSIPLSQQDINTMAAGLLWIAQPELVKIIMKNDQPIGFLLTYPDISVALQKAKGRLFPLGWIRMLWQKTHSTWLNVNGIGIIDEYRGMAGTALLFSELFKSVKANPQFKFSEIIQIGIENERMRQELAGMGIDFYKKHALFELNLE